MCNRNRLLLLGIFLLCTQVVVAQEYGNTLGVFRSTLTSSDHFYFRIPQKIFYQVGIQYERRIANTLSGRITFEKYNPWRAPRYYGDPVNVTPETKNVPIEYFDYKYLDLTLIKSYAWGRSKFHFGAGVTYAWGILVILDSVTQFAPGYDWFFNVHEENRQNLIPNFSLGYKFRFLRNHINIGIEEHLRYNYLLKAAYQFNTCLTLGYSFDFRLKGLGNKHRP